MFNNDHIAILEYLAFTNQPVTIKGVNGFNKPFKTKGLIKIVDGFPVITSDYLVIDHAKQGENDSVFDGVYCTERKKGMVITSVESDDYCFYANPIVDVVVNSKDSTKQKETIKNEELSTPVGVALESMIGNPFVFEDGKIEVSGVLFDVGVNSLGETWVTFSQSTILHGRSLPISNSSRLYGLDEQGDKVLVADNSKEVEELSEK